jgi:dethiobiotin synthetase
MISQLPISRYLITGTDTNCGKTYVTCQLLTYFNQRGYSAQALKPVVSGAVMLNNHLVYDDVIKLQRHNHNPCQDINAWHYKPAISPHLASRQVGQLITANEVAMFCRQPSFLTVDYLFVEGAGGLLAPINDCESWLEVACHLAMPVIIVVGMRLGCLNHALLTASVLTYHQIPCAGWIANCIDPDMLVCEENITTLQERMPMPLLTIIPYKSKWVD